MASNFIAYLDSVKTRDPAARSRWEVLLYPGVWALAFHRVAHWLYGGQLFFLARFVNHLSRMLTAIDIHPGAKI
ncbi:MAG: serine acetyltransferase, partial [Sphingomicrobium sp.]